MKLFLVLLYLSSLAQTRFHSGRYQLQRSQNHNKRIIPSRNQGQPVPISRAPFMASLILKHLIESKDQFLCSVTIIGIQWALTSASCIEKVPERFIWEEKVVMRSTINNLLSERKIDHRIINVTKHEYFAGKLNAYDYNIAILKINSPFVGTLEMPIDISPSDYAYDQLTQVTVYGWGLLNAKSKKIQPILMKVALQILPYPHCNRRVMRYVGIMISTNQMCTKDSPHTDCTSDEGGLVVGDDKKAIGIMSWTPHCFEANVPSVYTKLGPFYNWIFDKMKRL